MLWSSNTSTAFELVELFAGAGAVGKEWRLGTTPEQVKP